tara:strand:+ start:1676 stop:2338 length:663 start_codon:yes stop_codon:yes gene_type:complete
MLRKVKLYGKLAEFVGHKEFEVKVNSVAQAVSFLIHNFPNVEQHMSPQYYQVKVGNYDIDKDEINYPVGREDIHFIPVIAGAGSGTRKFLLGGALIGLAFVTGGASFSFAKGLTGSFLGTTAVKLGVGLAISGVSEMLAPMPKSQDFSSEEDPRLSFSFSGVQNTSRAGTPVPIVYGEIITGSVVISAATDTIPVNVPDPKEEQILEQIASEQEFSGGPT